ncbi:MAG: RpiB/LacA/LacB family sugar-phosphate isomerase [Lachnospirales bacterium]
MIIIGNDHGAIELKKALIEHLDKEKISYLNLGPDEKTSVDYPDIAKAVAEKMLEMPEAKGVLLCTTGVGISITANRYEHMRCALCHNILTAKLSREHNNANCIAMGGGMVGNKLGVEMLDAFINTDFSGGERHIRRIDKMNCK